MGRSHVVVSKDSRGIALAALSAILFGTLPIFAKYAYDDGAQAIPLLAARFFTATVLLVLFAVVAKRNIGTTRRRAARLLLLGAFGYAFEASLYFAALTRAPAGIVGLVFYSYPLWTNIGGLVTGLERFHPRSLVALALATGGIALIFSIPQTDLAGPLLALGAALAVSVYYLFAQVFVRDVEPLIASILTAAGAAVSLSVVGIVTGQRLPVDALPDAAALGLVTSLAFVCLYAAVAQIGSSKTAITHMLEPVTTVLLAALILGDEITARIGIGAALIVAALPILAARRRAKPLVE